MDNQLEKQLETNEKEDANLMASHESYEESFKTIKRGEYLTGTVVKIQSDGVYVDIGYKQEGFIPMNQLAHGGISDPSEIISEGEEVPVVVLKCNDMEGDVILSKKRADLETAWRNVTDAYKQGEIITATAVEAVKGGLLVDLGLRGFVPASQVDLRPVKDLNDFVGEALQLRVIELDKSRRKVVLSRKKVLEEERHKMKEETLNSLYEGQIVQGTIARVTNFGAFVNLGGVDGLVHISEIAWKRIKHPADAVKIGNSVDVMVLKVDKERERISLSIRQALPDPWSDVDETIGEGNVVPGFITKVAKNYVFVEVKQGVEGVVPVKELTSKRGMRPADMGLKEGQEVRVKVLNIRKEARRMLLSLRQAEDEGDRKDINKFTAKAAVVETPAATGASATIADILKAKMKESQKEEEAKEEAEPEIKEEKKPEEPAVKVEEKKAPPAPPSLPGIKPISATEIQKKVNGTKAADTEKI